MQWTSSRAWALSMLSAVLQIAIFPVAGPLTPWRTALTWVALVPLFLALLANGGNSNTNPMKQGFFIGYLCGFVWYSGNCYWIFQTMHLYGGLPEPVSFGILVLFSLYLGLYHALFATLFVYLRCHLGAAVALTIGPFLWVAVELARARITGFPWDLLGYSQVDNLLLTRLAPFAGVTLLSFVIAAGNSVLTAIWMSKTRHRVALGVLGLLFASLLQVAGGHQSPVAPATHLATLLQENLAVGATGHNAEMLPSGEKYRQFTAASLAPVLSVSKIKSIEAKPDFIIWPEAPADFATSDPLFLAQLANLARTASTTVVAGSLGVDFNAAFEGGYHEFGSAAIFDPSGKYLGRYDKIHRVPWGEYVPYKQLFFFAGNLVAGVGRMSPGRSYTIFNADSHRFGVFICYESIFGDEVRRFVQNGAEVLVNISDDGWYGDTGAPWQHLNMARMRAIETHRWILRDTNTGVTTAIDPHGRGIFTTPRHIRAAFSFPFNYEPATDLTFYTRYGDWFAYLCTLVTVLALPASRIHRSKPPASKEAVLTPASRMH